MKCTFLILLLVVVTGISAQRRRPPVPPPPPRPGLRPRFPPPPPLGARPPPPLLPPALPVPIRPFLPLFWNYRLSAYCSINPRSYLCLDYGFRRQQNVSSQHQSNVNRGQGKVQK
ncbi:hypothetical protein Q1695_003247 [Nippostrongylus brasiliensis]|nr:hypothetical protein Q1695_003247 [Nippostrongylus brasiliensis]